MTCPHCGAPQIRGNRFCHKCRRRVVPSSAGASADAGTPGTTPAPARRPVAPSQPTPGPGPDSFARPAIITLLAVLNILGGVFGIGLSVTLIVTMLAAGEGGGTAAVVFMLAVYTVVAGVQLATGMGLWRLEPWGRTLQIVLAGLGLLGIPCGTIISILVLVYMLKPEVKMLFSGVSPGQLSPDERTRVELLSRSSGATVVVVAGLVAILIIPFAGIVAAIAIPSLLRARVSANESMAIGHLRTVVSAEQAYASSNMGFSDELECLVEPSMCIPSYPSTAPSFLDSSLLAEEKGGYEFEFILGAPAPDEALQSGQVSESSLIGWALIAVPLQQGQTGVRSFCADAHGTLCFTPDGSVPEAGDGECPVSHEQAPADCWPLR